MDTCHMGVSQHYGILGLYWVPLFREHYHIIFGEHFVTQTLRKCRKGVRFTGVLAWFRLEKLN